MNWRRGLVFAGIHLAVCLPLVVWEEAHYWSQLQTSMFHAPVSRPGAVVRHVALQENEPVITAETVTVKFDCGSFWYHIPLQERIVKTLELPAAVISGWSEPCPVSWDSLRDLAPRCRSSHTFKGVGLRGRSVPPDCHAVAFGWGRSVDSPSNMVSGTRSVHYSLPDFYFSCCGGCIPA